jgi:hypothetical protein
MSGTMAPSLFDDSPVVPQLGEFETLSQLLGKLFTYAVSNSLQNSSLLIKNLCRYFLEAVTRPKKFEEFSKGSTLSPLIQYLSDECQNKAVVHALLGLKMHFSAHETDDDREVQISRGLACEYVAWRFITHLSGRESMEYLLYELPLATITGSSDDEESATLASSERSPLLRQSSRLSDQGSRSDEPFPRQGEIYLNGNDMDSRDDLSASFENLNALEIAAVSGAKKFLSQRVVRISFLAQIDVDR